MSRDERAMFFPKQPTVGVLNAVLSVSALAGMLCPPSWACLPASPSWACLCPCLLACLPCCLRSCLMSPSWACLRAFLRLVWDAVSALLGLSRSLRSSWSIVCFRSCLLYDAVSASCLRSCFAPCPAAGKAETVWGLANF